MQVIPTQNSSPFLPLQGPDTSVSPPSSQEEKLGSLPHYLVGNEKGVDSTLQYLEDHPECHRGMHVGFAGWNNLNIISATRSCFALIIDFDPKMVRSLDLIKACVIQSEDPESFISNFAKTLTEQLDPDEPFFLAGTDDVFYSSAEDFAENLPREGWLSSSENYDFVREMYTRNRIRHIKEDITNKPYFEKVKTLANRNLTPIKTIYTSNILEWLIQNGAIEDIGISPILRKDVTYIDAQKQDKFGRGGLIQRVTTLKEAQIPEITYHHQSKGKRRRA